MAKLFMPEINNQAERLKILRDNCDKVEVDKYIKELSDEERYARREQLSESALKLRSLEEKKKELMTSMKEEIDPVKRVYNDLLTEIKTGQVELEGEIFYYANHAEGMMEIYDHNGEIITSRRLRPAERQGNVFGFDGKAIAAGDK